MSRPKAYDPQHGYRYQILRYDEYNREYDHVDYAKDRTEKNYLLGEYRLADRGIYKAIELPQKFWKKGWYEQKEKRVFVRLVWNNSAYWKWDY